MEQQNNNQNQYRFFAAALLSMAVLFGWQYFFAPTPQPVDNANTAANANVAQPQTAVATPQTQLQQTVTETAQATPDTTPNRLITIKSPLYEVTLDSRGAVATSWILLKNVATGIDYPIYADGSTDADKKPLQLISQKALAQTPRDVPFRLITADPNITALANDRNYKIVTGEESVGQPRSNYEITENGNNITLVLGEGGEKSVVFLLTDPNGVQVNKTFLFRADSYVTDLSVSIMQNGQFVPNTRLAIGASIGDHAINHHTFYQIESEAVAAVDGGVVRKQGYYSFEFNAEGRASLSVPGMVDWAGVSDSYFAMAAIPATQTQGLELHAVKYDVDTQPYYKSIFGWVIRSPETKETRHLVTAYVPINADGSVTKVFTGTKDYFLLNPLSTELNKPNLVNLINFSNYSWIRPITATLSVPILYALHFFNGLTKNYGVAIIVFTFLFYSLLFPLRWKQSKSFKKAASNAPKMKELQEKIKDLQKKGVPMDDPRMRALQMDQLKMTKDALPIGGCLPMLLQFPLLIAFYTAITIAMDARQASFLWLPDLSAADPWHLLEFAFAISMVLAMKFTPTAPAVTPEQQMQQKMMMYLMPVMMLWVMWTAPAGLLLYWFFGNVVSFGQQMLINKMNKSGQPPEAEVVDVIPQNAKKVKGKPKLSTS